ncbi:MAG: Gfo/Idh/MocA family oxidoreductase [Ilumatobacteraceae bacterium]|jgi:myo-inositol 2-dehydrogenase / D-chiro-inositol 1-dehydrogenase
MSETIGYGIIGSGMMGGEHILDLNHVDGAAVLALADPVESSIEWGLGCVESGPGGAEAKSRVATYADHRELLADPNVDVVVITTPNFTHAAILADVLATDKHVLIEKPLCTRVEDCLRVVEAARHRDAITWMGLQYRFMPTPAAMLEQLDSGVCGTTHMVSIREHRYPFLGKVGDWNRFTRNTGGTLVEKCCHFFDLMHLVAGAHPVRVMASGGQDVNHLDEYYEIDGRMERSDILDNAFVIVEFANGVRGMLDLCMFAEGGRYEQELTITGDVAKLEATVPGDTVWVGERAKAEGHGHKIGHGVREVAAPMDPRVPYPDFHQGASFMEHLHLLDAIRAGRPEAVTVTEGMWAVATGAAAHRSIDERRPVELAEFGLS